jgi:hypothetical protein
MPRLLSQKEYAERIGVSAQYVNKLVREGKIELVDGRIDPKKADATRKIFERAGRMIPVKRGKKAAVKRTAAKKARRRPAAKASKVVEHKPRRAYTSTHDKPTSATRSFAAARAEREEWQAQLAKLDYLERCKKLLPADEVIAAQQRQNANFRTQLRKLARHAAPLAKRQRTESEIETVLLELIDQLLDAFSKDPLGRKPIDIPAPIVPAEVVEPVAVEEIAIDQVPAEVMATSANQEATL